MSEDEDEDLYDDEDDSIFEDEGEGDEGEPEDDLYDEEDESDLDEEYEEYEDESEAYDGPDESDLEGEFSSCFVCNCSDLADEDKWRFAVAEEDGGRVELWACKSCRDKFPSLEDFDEFRTNWTRSRLYRCAATLQRLVLLKAPDCLVAQAAFVVAGCLFSEDSEAMANYGMAELKKLMLRLNQTGSDR